MRTASCLALYQVDERKGYDGVRHAELASDARWQHVPLIPWVVYRDFREAALTRILGALAVEAERSGALVVEPTHDPNKKERKIPTADDDVHQMLEAERARSARMESALRRREKENWLLQRQVAQLLRQRGVAPGSPSRHPLDRPWEDYEGTDAARLRFPRLVRRADA